MEFIGMWGLKPYADLRALTRALAPERWNPPRGASLPAITSRLGVLRSACWFTARTRDFDGETLVLVSQFDGTLEHYLDDLVRHGRDNLAAIWGQCIGCPSGPGVTARHLVEYIARGQVRTLAVYDAVPSLSVRQIHQAADWQAKTARFQRAIVTGRARLEDTVSAFLAALAEPSEPLPAGAMVDADSR
jgi:hypothetical protein